MVKIDLNSRELIALSEVEKGNRYPVGSDRKKVLTKIVETIKEEGDLSLTVSEYLSLIEVKKTNRYYSGSEKKAVINKVLDFVESHRDEVVSTV